MKIFEKTKLEIDLTRLIDSRLLLCANSGGGKSYAIRKILEEAAGKVQCIMLDAEGEFRTIREKFDFLLIGQGGDIAINQNIANMLPRKLLELNVSTIIDIADLKRHERIMYMKKFIEALMDLSKKYWKPCLIFVDEAHAYCGQQGKQDSYLAIIDLMTRGRKRGYCGILATQRISKLHKDAAAEANNYMIGRTAQDLDQRRAYDILGLTSKDDMRALRNLKEGEFYAFGPAISPGIEKVKVAKVKTTHPKVGRDLRKTITPPTEKIKKMLLKLNDLPREAEQEAKTLKNLKKENRELRIQLRQAQSKKPSASPLQLEKAEQQGYTKAKKEFSTQIKETTTLLYQNNKILTQIKSLAEKNVLAEAEIKLIPRNEECGISKTHSKEKIDWKGIQHPTLQIDQARKKMTPMEIAFDPDLTLGKCEKYILSLLYNYPERAFKKNQIGVFIGYSHKSGGFNNSLSKLGKLNLIDRNGGIIQISEHGQQVAPELLGDDISLCERITIDNWAQKLGGGCTGKIFQYLLENKEESFTKEELGEAINYSPNSGGFNNSISRLITLGLICRQGGMIGLNPEILE